MDRVRATWKGGRDQLRRRRVATEERFVMYKTETVTWHVLSSSHELFRNNRKTMILQNFQNHVSEHTGTYCLASLIACVTVSSPIKKSRVTETYSDVHCKHTSLFCFYCASNA